MNIHDNKIKFVKTNSPLNITWEESSYLNSTYLVDFFNGDYWDFIGQTKENMLNYFRVPMYDIKNAQFRVKYFTENGESDYTYGSKFSIVEKMPIPKIILDEKYKNLNRIKKPIKVYFKVETFEGIIPTIFSYVINVDMILNFHIKIKIDKDGLYIDLNEIWNRFSLNQKVEIQIGAVYGNGNEVSREVFSFIKDSDYVVNGDYTNNDTDLNDIDGDKTLDEILEEEKNKNNFVEDIDYGKPSTVKKKYTNPRPMLYLYRGMPEVSLTSHDFDTAKNITLETQINEVSSLSFDIPYTINRKLEVNDCEKLVKFEGEYYIIKNIDTEDNEYATMKVDCVHESNELKGVYCTYIDLVGATPKQMFDKIMTSTMHPIDTGYRWAGTDVDINKKRHLQTENEQSVYQNLVEMAKVFNGWLEFYTDVDEVNWVYLRTKAIENGKFIKKGIDMKSLKLTYSSEEIFTRLYPLGAVDDSTGHEVNIMKVNPTGKSYVENYTYYLAKGIPTEVIDSRAMYQQLKTLRAEDYTSDKDLYEFALEELEKFCYPQLDATLTMEDLSVYMESLDEPPKMGYNIRCIDKEIGFVLGCMIMGVKRNYDNPSDTTVTISNIVRYNTFYQKLEHSADTTDKITKPDDGKDGSGGIYIPAGVVKDGDHVNVSMKLKNHQSLISQNAEEIRLTVEDLGLAKAEIKVNADSIQSTVTRVDGCESLIRQNADAIEQRVTNGDFNTYKKQTDREISQRVSFGSEFSSEMRQNVDTFQFLFNEASGKKTEITKDGISVYDGGFYVRDRHGNEVMWFDSDGNCHINYAHINDLSIKDVGDKSAFYASLANMKSAWFNEIGIGYRLNCDADCFYIRGRNLEDYVQTVCYEMLEDQGLI